MPKYRQILETKVVTIPAKTIITRVKHPKGQTRRPTDREYYYERLDELFPGLRQRYTASFGGRYGCLSPRANKLFEYFESTCSKLGILYKMRDITSRYKAGYDGRQLRLL